MINTVDITSATCLHYQESISRGGKRVNNSNLHKRLASSQAGEMCIVSTRYQYWLFILCLTLVSNVSAKCGIGGTLTHLQATTTYISLHVVYLHASLLNQSECICNPQCKNECTPSLWAISKHHM